MTLQIDLEKLASIKARFPAIVPNSGLYKIPKDASATLFKQVQNLMEMQRIEQHDPSWEDLKKGKPVRAVPPAFTPLYRSVPDQKRTATLKFAGGKLYSIPKDFTFAAEPTTNNSGEPPKVANTLDLLAGQCFHAILSVL